MFPLRSREGCMQPCHPLKMKDRCPSSWTEDQSELSPPCINRGRFHQKHQSERVLCACPQFSFSLLAVVVVPPHQPPLSFDQNNVDSTDVAGGRIAALCALAPAIALPLLRTDFLRDPIRHRTSPRGNSTVRADRQRPYFYVVIQKVEHKERRED